MPQLLLAFLPVAALLTITPGVATVLVVQRAARDGRRAALLTTAGNEIGVLVWAAAAAVGLAAVVAASAAVFTAVKLAGALVLLIMGLRALLHRGPRARLSGSRFGRERSAFASGLVTAIANPKLAVFFVALFPQFVPSGSPVLGAALAMALLLVVLDLVWYSVIAVLVARAADVFLGGPWMRRAERACGAMLVALGLRLALEER
jgi:threonine/homoserine/homoserine lactone efflux protein